MGWLGFGNSERTFTPGEAIAAEEIGWMLRKEDKEGQSPGWRGGEPLDGRRGCCGELVAMEDGSSCECWLGKF